jgi:hypothetical protein
MNADVVVQAIQAVIAPTVMISACTLIQNTLLARYSGVGDRLRALVRERLQLLEDQDITEPIYSDVLRVIDRQLIVLIQRYSLLQKTSLLLHTAIGCFLLTMFAIALARVQRAMIFPYGAVGLFLLGTATLLLGVFLAASEVRISHRAVRSEVHWALSLSGDSRGR